jgi:DNA-binding response OmpR family regulator
LNKILLLEDDHILLETVEELLEIHDYKVDIAQNGDEVLDLTFNNNYALYIFDINVPKINGFKLIELLRKADDFTPVIYISALTDIKSITTGFSLGAVDYLKKPFHPQELILRVKNILNQKKNIEYKNIQFQNNRIFKNGNEIILTNIQHNIFVLLIQNIGRVVKNNEFYEVLGNDSNNALRFHINRLRKILEIDIKNIRGVGYILEKTSSLN